MNNITAHCIVKNEENFVGLAIKSVVFFVDQILIFDTGSTDMTTQIIKELCEEFPNKIVFEEKGDCDKSRHTELRQEMLNRTKTDWFMILDGDEIWTKKGAEELIEIIRAENKFDCLIAPFYLCVGDIYHTSRKDGSYKIFDRIGSFSPRVMKITKGIHWSGAYGSDTLLDESGNNFVTESSSKFLKNKYWHLTHLRRSAVDSDEFSSGGLRINKLRETYCVIGKKINDALPEVIDKNFALNNKLSKIKSSRNFIELVLKKIWSSRLQFSKYFTTGIIGLFLDILSLYIFKEYFGMRPVVAVILNQAILLNVIFIVNNYWSFSVGGVNKRQITRFYFLSACNYLFSITWMWLVNEKLDVYYLFARLSNVAMAVSWNFLLYKYWVYKK